MDRVPKIIKDSRACLQYTGGVGFIPGSERVSYESVTHGGPALMSYCDQEVGVSCKVPIVVVCFIAMSLF